MDALLNCEWDNVRSWSLFFLARSHVVYWFLFCLSRVLSYGYPLFFNLWVHCCSFPVVLLCLYPRSPSTLYKLLQWSRPHINPRIFNGDHNHKRIKTDSSPVTLTYILIHLSLNKYIGRQLATTRYVAVSKICNCLSVYYYVKSQLVRQPAASNVNMINVPPFSTVLPSSVSSIVHNEHIEA